MRRNTYLPEGIAPPFPEHQPLSALLRAMKEKTILTGMAVRCDGQRDLWVRFGGYEGVISRSEAVHPLVSGAERDVAVLSRVGKHISFVISSITADKAGRPIITLSRKAAQQKAMDFLLARGTPGAVLPARVTHLAPFGAFVDLGCGVISMVPLENLSMSRITHPSDRVLVGQDLLVLVTAVDPSRCRFQLSHKELLGTWLENAAHFAAGDTVTGVVRSVHDYGAFVELRPNLSGLADLVSGVQTGDYVTVYIRSIRPEKRKIKLQILELLGDAPPPQMAEYCITDGPVENWRY